MAIESLTTLQKAACEAIWRRISDRQDPVGFIHVDLKAPNAKRLIAEQVALLPTRYLEKIVLPEILNYGGLAGGYGARWAADALASKPSIAPAPIEPEYAACVIRPKTSQAPPPFDTKNLALALESAQPTATARTRN